jgi:hypothetical protein
MKARDIVLSVALLPLLSVSMAAQKITVDHDKNTDFSQFKTYAWKKGTPAANPLNDERIVQAIEKQLASKGLLKLENTSMADLAVAYHAAVELETQLNTTDMGGWGWGPYYGGGTAITTVDKIPIGTLIVDMGDVKNKKLIWRGTASDTVSDKPEKLEKKINEVTTKLFKKYPPEVKKK